MVYRPRRRASASAVSRLGELPLVDIAIAMSPVFARAISWRANTSSNPTSLPSAVRIAWSAVSDQAGRGLPSGGRANKAASVVESVQLPPFPNVNSLPPAANRRASWAAARDNRSALASSVARRSARLSDALACADAARSASSEEGSSSSASMNGYKKLVGSSAGLMKHLLALRRRRRGPMALLLGSRLRRHRRRRRGPMALLLGSRLRRHLRRRRGPMALLLGSRLRRHLRRRRGPMALLLGSRLRRHLRR